MNSVKQVKLFIPSESTTNGAHPPKEETIGKIDDATELLEKLQGYNNGYLSTNGTLPPSEEGKIVSEAVYWADYYEHPDYSYEWENGELQVKPMARIGQAFMYQWMIGVLTEYLRHHPIAHIVNLEIGFHLPIMGGSAVRKPDAGVALRTNPNPIAVEDRTYNGIIDLCIESLSDSKPSEITRDTKRKFKEYEYAGVQEYYILDDIKDRHMSFFALDANGNYQPMDTVPDGIVRSAVLPGFQFRIRDLFECPSLEELINDPIYQGFIMTDYQAAQLQIQEEQQRANQAEQRAQAAEDELARLRALLQESGLQL
ncbi:MAG: Uma2 family endonuclease [Chloroflexota bacterium]